MSGTLLAVDPSSTRTGYALLRVPGGDVIDAGFLSGRARDAAIGRAMEIGDELIKLVADVRPDLIVIELPGPRTPRAMWKRNPTGHGQAVYGACVGVIYRAAWQTGVEVIPISAHEWTGRASKERRGIGLAMTSAAYRAAAAQDRGRDVADAIELGRWWIGRTRMSEVETRK